MSDDPGPAAPLSSRARAALTLTVVLIGVYVVLDLVAQLLPPHYSPISQAESDLAVGPYGYVMTLNFLMRGILSLSFLVGLSAATGLGSRSRAGVAFLAAWGVGAFILAASPTDVSVTETTGHGKLHLLVAFIAFLAAVVGEVLLSRRFSEEPRLRPIAGPSQLISVLAAVSVVLLFVGTGVPYLLRHAFGLLERIFLGFVLAWILVVSLYLLGSVRSYGAPATAGP
ncbi:MAG: DUF998 domain-containing protein [Thermoplasmata archaeon]|jgi:hypothetical protein